MTIDIRPIDSKTPDRFDGFLASPKGTMRYRNVEKVQGFPGFPHRYTCPDGVYLYMSQGTLTHWSELSDA